MTENDEITNRLINWKSLRWLMKDNKVRAGQEVLEEFEKLCTINIERCIDSARENMVIHGRKNLKPEDIPKENKLIGAV